MISDVNREVKAERVPFVHSIDMMHKIIDCETFDCVELDFNGTKVDAWVDDNGMYSDKSIFKICGKPLAGNILLTGHDDEGNTTSLSDDQIKAIHEELNHGILVHRRN